MREAILLLAVFALMALSAKAEGAELRVEKQRPAPVAAGIGSEVELETFGPALRW